MKLTLMALSITLSNLFLFINHPISLVIVIILQALTLCSLIFILFYSNWFALMMFLIFMGGLMVLFIYIASLASNEMFLINLKFLSFLSITLIISTMITIFMFPSTLQLNSSLNFKMKIFSLYSEYLSSPVALAMIYLLLTLIVTVNIIKLYDAPIRSIIYENYS